MQNSVPKAINHEKGSLAHEIQDYPSGPISARQPGALMQTDTDVNSTMDLLAN